MHPRSLERHTIDCRTLAWRYSDDTCILYDQSQ